MTFEWVCDGCGEPVADGKGHIEVYDGEAMRYEREELERRRDRSADRYAGRQCDLAELTADPPGGPVDSARLAFVSPSEINAPGQAHWMVFHRGCDPRPDLDGYGFSVEDCRTLEDLLDWNAHLAEKSWISFTDWHRFIQRRLAPPNARQGPDERSAPGAQLDHAGGLR
jgi:hypothetical protein